jgi:L-aspartate oxidase
MSINQQFDVLIIGSGAAGLMSAMQLSEHLTVALIAKDQLLEGSSYYAQGGISAVLDSTDDFNSHIQDTVKTGFDLGDEQRIRFMVEQAPDAIKDLEKAGVKFSQQGQKYDLTTEGGHSAKRVAHVADKTGQSVQINLLAQVRKKSNITLFEYHTAIDLLTKKKQCFGAYVYDKKTDKVSSFVANKTIIATGGASKAYLYTSNPDTSTGDGVAMAYRAGCEIVNMEFAQFHPTCLFHSKAKSFLISETLRGEGAKLILPNGKSFMHKYDDREEMAPRDIVARAIDHEMKTHGFDCVYLDLSFKDSNWITKRFPTITERCLSLGIDICNERIPVVPAAHYTCGGVGTDINAQSSVANLYAIGEVAHSGVHGANRMASNSLLECLVFAKTCAKHINSSESRINKPPSFDNWDASRVEHSREKVVVSHLWQEVRRLMWNFVGIVRSNRRLESAQKRLDQIQKEVNDYYSSYIITEDLIELRNLVQTAQIIVESALSRKESRGLHFTLDYPEKLDEAQNSIIVKS